MPSRTIPYVTFLPSLGSMPSNVVEFTHISCSGIVADTLTPDEGTILLALSLNSQRLPHHSTFVSDGG